MPQEFQVLQCYQCQTFQVHQVKKTNKWNCKLCGVKQSVIKVYGRGSGIDCRHHVQKLNQLRGEQENVKEQILNCYDQQIESYDQRQTDSNSQDFSTGRSEDSSNKWMKYVDITEQYSDDNDEGDNRYTTDKAQFINATKRKRVESKKKENQIHFAKRMMVKHDDECEYDTNLFNKLHNETSTHKFSNTREGALVVCSDFRDSDQNLSTSNTRSNKYGQNYSSVNTQHTKDQKTLLHKEDKKSKWGQYIDVEDEYESSSQDDNSENFCAENSGDRSEGNERSKWRKFVSDDEPSSQEKFQKQLVIDFGSNDKRSKWSQFVQEDEEDSWQEDGPENQSDCCKTFIANQHKNMTDVHLQTDCQEDKQNFKRTMTCKTKFTGDSGISKSDMYQKRTSSSDTINSLRQEFKDLNSTEDELCVKNKNSSNQENCTVLTSSHLDNADTDCVANSIVKVSMGANILKSDFKGKRTNQKAMSIEKIPDIFQTGYH